MSVIFIIFINDLFFPFGFPSYCLICILIHLCFPSFVLGSSKQFPVNMLQQVCSFTVLNSFLLSCSSNCWPPTYHTVYFVPGLSVFGSCCPIFRGNHFLSRYCFVYNLESIFQPLFVVFYLDSFFARVLLDLFRYSWKSLAVAEYPRTSLAYSVARNLLCIAPLSSLQSNST